MFALLSALLCNADALAHRNRALTKQKVDQRAALAEAKARGAELEEREARGRLEREKCPGGWLSHRITAITLRHAPPDPPPRGMPAPAGGITPEPESPLPFPLHSDDLLQINFM